jgi:hypothetical protein
MLTHLAYRAARKSPIEATRTRSTLGIRCSADWSGRESRKINLKILSVTVFTVPRYYCSDASLLGSEILSKNVVC